MLFPPIPKTHWWGTELDKGPASKSEESEIPISSGTGRFAIGPTNPPPLDLGMGVYEFRSFLWLSRIPKVKGKLGVMRVLSEGKEVEKRPLEVADFNKESGEAEVALEFKLEKPCKNIQCEFICDRANVSISLIWLRLIPRFGWKWNKWDHKSLYFHGKVSDDQKAVTLKAHPEDKRVELYGPYIDLPSGYYKLTALVSAEPESVASWEIIANRGRKPLYELDNFQFDPLYPTNPREIVKPFSLDSGRNEVEFRIRVKQGKVTVYWLRLVSADGLIWERYYELGGRDSKLGLPISAEGRAKPSVSGTKGRYRRFEGGTIYFNNANYSAWEVSGAINSLYEKLGGTGAQGIGFPMGPVKSIESSFGTVGEFQRFKGWGEPTIFAYPEDRDHVCAIYGGISSTYWEIGGPSSPLGFPTSENEYGWEEDGVVFRRSDFEGGFIIYSENKDVEGKTVRKMEVHHYPRPRIDVTWDPKRVFPGQDLVITVTGTLDGGPCVGAWCTISFPDEIQYVDSEPIKVEGGAEDPQSQVTLRGADSASDYGTGRCKLQYPRVEMSRWGVDWPVTDNSFEVTVRAAKPGPFRIFARFTAQDDENLAFYGADPDRRWILEPEGRGQMKGGHEYLGRDGKRRLDVVKDQQNEAVYVYEVQVDEPDGVLISPSDDFDVFLCHNGEDKPEVKRIAEKLKDRGILPWLDEWQLRPGVPWQRSLEKQIGKIKSAAVFVGKNGIGPWQQMELEAFLREFVNRGCPVIPVLLEDAPSKPPLPIFLAGMTWVDFRKPDSDPIGRLIWGITGKRL